MDGIDYDELKRQRQSYYNKISEEEYDRIKNKKV